MDLYGATLSSTAAEEMAANFSEMNSNNKRKHAPFFDIKEFEMKARKVSYVSSMSLGKKEVAEQVANTLLEYCKKSSTTTSVVPPPSRR